MGQVREPPGMATGMTPVSLQVMGGGKVSTTWLGISAWEAGMGGLAPERRAGEV